MSKLMLTVYEDSKFRMNNFRLSPLITWLQFFNFFTIAIVCLLFLKIYKGLAHLFEWFFSYEGICENPIILLMGQNNEIVHEMAHQLSQKFDSGITHYHDVNDNYSAAQEEITNNKKSQLIINNKSINSQDEIIDFAKFIRKNYGYIDILVIVRKDEPVEKSSPDVFLHHLNKQLLSQFWTVMAFLPTMMRRNSGRIISIALGKSPVTNTGIMKTIYEDHLQSDSNVKLTLIERNTLIDFYCSCLPTDIFVKVILRSMWTPNAIIKVPPFSCFLLLPSLLLSKFVLKPVSNFISTVFNKVL